MFNRQKLFGVLTALAVGAGLLSSLAIASPAAAICDGPKFTYTYKSKVKTYLPTNVTTPWLEYPHTLSLSQTKTASTTATGTVTASIEEGIVFVKANESLSISVGKTWSKASTWTATGKPPKGKEGRLRLYHEAYGFTVTKKALTSPCNYKTVWTSKVKAPRKTGGSKVFMNTRKISGMAMTGVSADVTALGGLPVEKQTLVKALP